MTSTTVRLVSSSGWAFFDSISYREDDYQCVGTSSGSGSVGCGWCPQGWTGSRWTRWCMRVGACACLDWTLRSQCTCMTTRCAIHYRNRRGWWDQRSDDAACKGCGAPSAAGGGGTRDGIWAYGRAYMRIIN